MFDAAQHGTVETHRYRGYYDAQSGSTTACAYCGRVIRFCYAMHNQHGKTFVIGSCHFEEYKGTKAFIQLRAARVLQEALSKNIRYDLKYFGDKAEVKERRRAWVVARRTADKKVRTYVMLKGDWLPKELFDLRSEVEKKPRQYKRASAARRWYEQQTEKIISLTNQAPSI